MTIQSGETGNYTGWTFCYVLEPQTEGGVATLDIVDLDVGTDSDSSCSTYISVSRLLYESIGSINKPHDVLLVQGFHERGGCSDLEFTLVPTPETICGFIDIHLCS